QLSLMFCSYCYGRLLVHLSFPTRRSSDLGLLRALRRGLHGADLLERLAALGRRRDRREEERPRALHDHPELVEQRLQPGDQALRSEEHTSELQSRENLVCRLLLEKKKN